jgi:hypothetical protein
MERHGWHLLFHEGLVEQLQKLNAAATRAQAQDPKGWESNANVKLFNAFDEHSLRSSGAKTDPYVVFQKMPTSGHPPL